MRLKSAVRGLTPRATRAYPILAGPLRGRTIVTSLHDYPAAILGRTEIQLIRWFRNSVTPGEVWLDVGAHYGYTTIALAELVGENGRVFAFEPSLSTAGFLNRTCVMNRLSQVTVVPFGLAEPGEFRIVRAPIERGMANHGLGGAPLEQVFLVGFDYLWMSIGGSSIHGVKIDVQGMELQVLAGMTSTLMAEHPQLIIEFHAGVDREATLDFLGKIGYRLPATPIEPLPGEPPAAYHDNRNYHFSPYTQGSSQLSTPSTTILHHQRHSTLADVFSRVPPETYSKPIQRPCVRRNATKLMLVGGAA